MANGLVQETVPTLPGFYEEKTRFSGVLSWILTTDHKRIAIMYLVMMLTFFSIGASLGFTMKLELMRAGPDILTAQMYNAVFSLHGVIMIFLFVIPGLPAVFGNFFLPIQIGAEDVAFPRLNLLSWYLFVIGALVAIFSMFAGGTPPDSGWTFYAPYSIRTTTNVSLTTFAAFILGFSSILTGLNFVTTIHRLRAKEMGWFQMPLFSWSLYATGWIQVLATPVLGITLALVIVERNFGIGLFDPAKGGDPILFQHMFWIYSHPAVYIMILPAMGAMSDIIATFSKKMIYGYKSMIYALMSIAFVGYLVWGHHMFVSGQSDFAAIVFSLLTFLVGVPTGIKIFNWIATLYKGSIELKTPMLFALAFIVLFSIGGFTGLMNGTLSLDIHVHDTYFVVAHLHYVVFGGTGFGFFGALLYWFPKMTGKMYHEGFGRIAWFLMFVGFNVLYFPMFILGLRGLPRRYFDYPADPKFTFLNVVSTTGSWIMLIGIIILFATLLYALFKGKKAPRDPWGGGTLEWTVPSPPPLLNFEEEPKVTKDPYDFTRALSQ